MTAAHIAPTWNRQYLHDSASHYSFAESNPAGMIELTDQELLGVDGGTDPITTLILTIALTIITSTRGCNK